MSDKTNLPGSSGSLQPVIFLGHGSPMNAIEDNSFTQSLNRLGQTLVNPRAILCVSAHWMTKGTWVTHMERPKTIHDFYGFPQELFDVNYPAPGSPALAEKISQEASDPKIFNEDSKWGLDHGTWSVLKHMYPRADVPVVQLSLDMSQPPSFHFQLGQKLKHLREQGVLIIGSGNIVHNLSFIRWETSPASYDWAIDFDEWTKAKLLARDFSALQNEATRSESGRLSIPTLDHYLPLMYILGAADRMDELSFDFEGIQNGSISMRCVRFS